MLLSARAWAEPDESAKLAARDAMAKGRTARDHGDLHGALEYFSAADDIMHVPTTALEVAKTQAALARLVEAKATLDQIAAMPVAADEAEAFTKARSAAVQLQHEVTARTPSLLFSTTPAEPKELALRVDGNTLRAGQWAHGYPVNPGHHEIVAESAGKQIEREVDVGEHESTEIALDFGLAEESQAKPSPERAAPSPATDDGNSRLNTNRTYVYGLSALALGGAAAGVTFGLVGKGRKHDLEHQCAPNCTSNDVARVRSMYTLANVSFAVSAASAISALILYAVSPSAARAEASATRSLRLSLQAGPAATGLTVDGRF